MREEQKKKENKIDIMIVGAGPVGLMCAYLGHLSGLNVLVVDKNEGPLEVGRADALNARTLQLLELAGIFDELYPHGKKCDTSSVWADGKFISRDSRWWKALEGTFHKHFLMLGQSHIEKLIDRKLTEMKVPVRRSLAIENVEVVDGGVVTTLSNGEKIFSDYVIGADGSRSIVRELFKVPFEIERPQIIWAVIDGIIETDFQKVPEIIVFQAETSDVAWIPREGKIDRFYIRMDRHDFTIDEAIQKINFAMSPHKLKFKEIEWFSHFSVKESVATHFFINERVFLAGDSCHIHSVNGGQGLNTGLGDAFNLIWKINMVKNFGSPVSLLESYEEERKPVALSVVKTSGELVRSTKFSENGTHAMDYVKIVEKRSGNITGMGISYGDDEYIGKRVFDIPLEKNGESTRLYSLLDYTKFTLLIFSDEEENIELPPHVRKLQIYREKKGDRLWSPSKYYQNMTVLVRPDSYIESVFKCFSKIKE